MQLELFPNEIRDGSMRIPQWAQPGIKKWLEDGTPTQRWKILVDFTNPFTNQLTLWKDIVPQWTITEYVSTQRFFETDENTTNTF